ncbi:hypothetical protein D3C73_527750 [compost metagenome]
MDSREHVLVYAPNGIGENFIKQLQAKQIPFAVMVNSKVQQRRMEQLGIKLILRVNTKDHSKWVIPEMTIRAVYMFENSVTLCCRFIQICRQWTLRPLFVVTKSVNPRLIYKALGADYVIYTNRDQVSFLLEEGEE